jgi:Glycosyltransferases, probably involved in cell wall biogenesis
MATIALIIIILYSVSLLYIFLFSLGQLHLTWVYLKSLRHKVEAKVSSDYFPKVTIQLPVFNEKYVVERLIEAISNFNYPKDKLEIQILDDSTDETTELILHKIEALRPLHLDIQFIHRENRAGFKAGALQNGFHLAKGEYIAIFDADFIPTPDFLLKTIPLFVNEKVGVVQTRWGHLNKDYSLLTQLQAFGLDAHFSIEQTARGASGSFINFNGTCGVWRKATIQDAGGWSSDTLTEDLDLSYRAQLKGWHFSYLEDVETPGELPIIMPAIKSQQYRWNKGAAETARKNFGNVLRSSLSGKSKVHAFFHLFNSSVFVSLLVAAVLSIPMLYIKSIRPELELLFDVGIIFLVGFLSISFFYWIATRRFYPGDSLKKFASLYPRFLIVSMGLSLHNGLAVMEGLLGRKTPFIRTPKFNLTSRGESWKKNSYVHLNINFQTIIEGILALYFVFGLVVGLMLKDGGLMIFHAMLALGFGSVFIYSVKPAFHER